MMIDQVISWVLVVQHYFLWLCRYAAIYVKRLASLTFHSHSELSSGGGGDSDIKQISEKKRLKPISDIPGPKCIPFLGSLLEFNQFGSRRVHELSLERHAKYGDIFRERLLSQEMIFLANTELMKQWMVQEGKMPTSLKQEPSLIFAEMYPQLKRGLFFRNGEDWFRLRKLGHFIVHKNASDFDVHGLFDGCQDILEGFMKTLAGECNARKGAFDVEIMSYEVTVAAIMSIVYGKNEDKLKKCTGANFKTLSTNAKEINENHQQLLEGSGRLAKWFNTKAWETYHTKLRYNLETCIKFGQTLREEIKQNPEACSMKTHGLLYKTIGLNADLRDIDDLLCDFAADTKDPFAGTVMFTTLGLAMYPEVQERILEEINQVYPDNQPITYRKLKELQYTEGFMREILRLYPVAAFTVRVPENNVVIGEYHIPPGTILLYSTWVAQRDPRYFSDPDKLIPERWLKQSQLYDGMSNLRCDSKAFAAFGLGQRICLGQYVAFSVLIMYIANLVRNFKLTYASPELEVEMKTILYPKNPDPVILQVRREE